MKHAYVFLSFLLYMLPMWSVCHKIGECCSSSPAYHVDVANNIVYVANGYNGMQVISVADPMNPTLINTFETEGDIRYITVVDTIAYVIDGLGMLILSVSDPYNITVLSSLYYYYEALRVAIVDNIAYLSMGSAGLQIFSVEDPYNPAFIGYCDVYCYAVSVADGIACVTSFYSGVHFISVSDPGNPIYLSTYLTPDCPIDVTLIDDIAYIVDQLSGLQIVSLADPANPTLVGSYDISGLAMSVSIADNIAYVVDTAGLQIISLENLQNPSLLCSYYSNMINDVNFLNVALQDGIAFVASSGGDHGLHIISVDDPQNPALLGSIDTPQCALSVRVANDVAFVADDESGLQIISVANSHNPSLISSINLWNQGHTCGVALSDNFAYVVNGLQYLDVFSIADPQNPISLSSYDALSHGNSITVVDDIAYVADGLGLQLISVANPYNLTLLGSINTYASSLAVLNDLAYVTSFVCMSIISISDPHNPTLLGSYSTPDFSESICVSGNVAYVAVKSSGLYLIDVTNPTYPFLISSILPHSSSFINCCLVSGNRLYVSDIAWNEISIYDVSIPQTPLLVNRYAWNMGSTDMFVANGKLYTTNGDYGLSVHNLSAVEVDDVLQSPPATILMRNFPNPFNPQTTIEFYLPSSVKTNISIYNLRGQLVKNLLDGVCTTGNHSIVWDGLDNNNRPVSSGVYYYNMNAGKYSSTQKMIMMK